MMGFRIRLTSAVSGLTNFAGDRSPRVDLDPGEYFIHTHPSGHLQIELPEQRFVYLPFDDFENGVKSGIIAINS